MPAPLPERLLVIDDDADLREALTYTFTTAGFEVHSRSGGGDGLAAVRGLEPDVVLLDVMLPDMTGTEVCRRIRSGEAGGRQPAVVMVTAKGGEIDRVVGFEVGADDYVVKPFSARELVLRVEAIVRARRNVRAATGIPAPRRYAVGSLQIDVDGHYVYAGGRQLRVSALEMRLLIHMVENRGRVMSREKLLEEVWGYAPNTATRTVDTHILRLRRKLGEGGAIIESVRGAGYRLATSMGAASDQVQVTTA